MCEETLQAGSMRRELPPAVLLSAARAGKLLGRGEGWLHSCLISYLISSYSKVSEMGEAEKRKEREGGKGNRRREREEKEERDEGGKVVGTQSTHTYMHIFIL